LTVSVEGGRFLVRSPSSPACGRFGARFFLSAPII
jgi:hypothetical protein